MTRDKLPVVKVTVFSTRSEKVSGSVGENFWALYDRLIEMRIDLYPLTGPNNGVSWSSDFLSGCNTLSGESLNSLSRSNFKDTILLNLEV